MAAKKPVALGVLLLLAGCGGSSGGGSAGRAGFVYVTNELSDTVSAYAIDAGSGALADVPR